MSQPKWVKHMWKSRSYMGTAVNGSRSMSIEDCPLKGGIKYGIIPAGYIKASIIILLLTLPLLCSLICNEEKKVKNF